MQACWLSVVYFNNTPCRTLAGCLSAVPPVRSVPQQPVAGAPPRGFLRSCLPPLLTPEDFSSLQLEQMDLGFNPEQDPRCGGNRQQQRGAGGTLMGFSPRVGTLARHRPPVPGGKAVISLRPQKPPGEIDGSPGQPLVTAA